jgi:two-component system, NarL family, response regulator YdfI
VIRVFIVAASRLARAGLENLLAGRGVEVVGSGTMDSLARELCDLEIDAILMDASGEQYEAVLESITEADLTTEAAVVLLTDQAPSGSPANAFREGVRAVLPSDVSPDQLVATLQAAAAGLFVVRKSDMQAAIPATVPASPSFDELAEPLTRREREVLQMLAAGLGNKEIASRLGISDHTVKFHVASILAKLGAETRTEAVSLGIRRGLVLL